MQTSIANIIIQTRQLRTFNFRICRFERRFW